jgi:hypothetical protein
LGIVLCVRGLIESRIAANLDHRGMPADATVVAVDNESITVPSGGLTQWTNVTVTFFDAGGAARRATQEGRDSTKVGERLRIRYDPQDPGHVRWEGSIDSSAFDLWTGVVGIVACLGFAFAAIRSARRLGGTTAGSRER